MVSPDRLNAIGMYVKNNDIDKQQFAKILNVPINVLNSDLAYQGNIYNKSVRFYYALSKVSGVPLDDIIKEIKKLNLSINKQKGRE